MVIVGFVAVALLLAGISLYVLTQPGPVSANIPPTVNDVTVTPAAGDNTTSFTFVADVSDDRDPPSSIQVRWDWENDSAWDTPWSTGKAADHLFAQPGDYTVRVEAIDTGNLTATVARQVRVSHAPLRVGTILSLTGPLQGFGVSQQNAVDMAVEEINAAGGVFGQPIQVFHMDDHTSPIDAQNAAMTLVGSDKVVAIIGATGSFMCASVLQVAKATAVFEVAPSCTSPIFSDLAYTGGWFARTVPSDALQAAVAASYAHENRTFAMAGVIALNNDYGVGTAAAFVSNFTRFGGVITGSLVLIDPLASDYTSDLHLVLDANPPPEVVYAIVYPPSGVVLMRNWWEGLGANPGWANVSWMFSDAVYDQSNFIDPLVSAGVDVSAFEGTSPAVYAQIEPPEFAAWSARYQAIYGTPPALFAANSYDAAYLVALAAEAVGFAGGAGIRAKIQSVADPAGTVVRPNEWNIALQELAAGRDIDYEGASGPANLNGFGDVAAPYIVWALDASSLLYTKEFFNESLVVSLLPAGSFPLEAPLGPAQTAASPARGSREEPASKEPRTFL
ncbi:MAG TPA: ABC transporter substrate-binding protein [Thermoplasmata archaeon]